MERRKISPITRGRPLACDFRRSASEVASMCIAWSARDAASRGTKLHRESSAAVQSSLRRFLCESGDSRFAACAKDSGHVNETIAATGGTPSRESSARQRGVVDADGYAIVTTGAAGRRSAKHDGSGEYT